MSDLSRNNHRQRTRDTYLDAGADAFQDHNLLEMLLFYAIPRKDVKPIAYSLINSFGSLENVFKADIEDLKDVEGVGENTPILIKLVSDLNKRCFENRNKNTARFVDFNEYKSFIGNLFVNANNEKFLVITLTSSRKLINRYFISEGTPNHAEIDPKRIVKYVLSDNAVNVIVAHNHPQSAYTPSNADLRFTKKLYTLLNTMGIRLVDHVIVGENGIISLANDTRYLACFNLNF
ncbi:MAG: RadC family protein [Eubacterium sp.]|nr:RadC family protein [Eubacterium sp.]